MAEDDRIRCDACPVACIIKLGQAGACDRYANMDGQLVRVDPHVILSHRAADGGPLVSFLGEREWDGDIVGGPAFVTAIGAGTTYPDYKPAPFIVASQLDGIDVVTVVTEGIFSYCGVKVKIDTDRHVGDERSQVRVDGEPVGHVTTGEYGSQMLSLGGVHHLTGSGKKTGRVTCDALLTLCNGGAVEMEVDGGVTLVVQAGQPPVIDGHAEQRMRVGCGSATIGMFAKQWQALVDDVVVVDDHITGVLSEHAAGQGAGHPRHRHPRPGPPVDARPVFRGRRTRHGLGRHVDHGPALDPRHVRPEEGAARDAHADGRHHGGARRLLRTRRRAGAA